ncbi:MAG: SRPBCC family protein, partial [Vicinamibacterales bacterium]
MQTLAFLLIVLLGAALPGTAQTAAPGGVIVHEAQGVYRVTAQFAVAAPPEAVLAVLTDYENIPRFMPDVTRSIVRAREPHRAIVEQEAQARVMLFSKTIHLLLDIE